ncbi:MAG: arginine--tRNA ligase [Firmicutes bacterium]|nr:arginine--tRNA ligase [Bacillota bacterium]
MIDFKQEIAKILAQHVQGLTAEEIAPLVEVPADKSHGDYAFPCFRLAKTMRKAPQLIASELAAAIGGAELFEKVEPVNAFVNMFINKEFFVRSTLTEVFSKGSFFGSTDLGVGKKVIVEFSSPNIAKPFHIGHIRTTVIGNSLYKIFDFLGYDVVRINHLGDYGTQFGKMIVAYRHWGSKEEVEAEPIKTLLAYYVRFHEEAEKDPSLEEEARLAFAALERGDEAETALWQWIRDESLKEFNRVYRMMDIDFDSWAGESFYSDKMPAVIEELREKGLLVESRGAQIVDLEPYGLTPAIITKSDGTSIYLTRDLAAAIYRKKTYDFNKCIYVVASQQDLHFKQLFKVLELMGYGWAKDCIHVNFGMVSLPEGTLSTRKGRVVFLEDVLNTAVEKTRDIVLEKGVNAELIEETAKTVGIGAVMFNELSASRIKDYTFDWDEVLNFDGETGPYVQYTHARCASVLRNAEEKYGSLAEDEVDDSGAFRCGVSKVIARALEKADLSTLTGPAAYDLVKELYEFPAVVIEAAAKYEPSVITRHIVDIAQSFNKFYHDEHIIVDDEAERRAKLMLTAAAKQAIKNGLGLLGIKAPERM